MIKFTQTQIEENLQNHPEWDYENNQLYTEFEFDNFKDCFSAMSRIAFECERLNHHPDWSNTYNVLTIKLSTHDADGVTQKDFDLAEAIDAIVIGEDED